MINNPCYLFCCCPFDILLKIRLNLAIREHQLLMVSANLSMETLYSMFVKNKIKCIIEETTIDSSEIDIGVTNHLHIFDFDPINNEVMHYGHSTYDDGIKNEIRLNYKNMTHVLTFIVIDNSIHFNMTVYSDKNIIKNDNYHTEPFDLYEQNDLSLEVGQLPDIHVCFKCYNEDDIVFIGSNTFDTSYKRKTFALIYNNNSNSNSNNGYNGDNRQDGDCFNYVTLDPTILNVYFRLLTCNVFIHRNKKILCVSECEYKYEPSKTVIYFYDIVKHNLITKMIINNVLGYCYDVSLEFIASRLVYVKYDMKFSNVITLIWINVDNMSIEETTDFVVKDRGIVGIKLIGIHNYLSAMIIINKKKETNWDWNWNIYASCSVNIYYF